MIPNSMVQGHAATLNQLSVAALADLRALLVSVESESPPTQRAILFEAFPDVFDPHAAMVSAVSATFYEEVRDAVGVSGPDTSTIDRVDSGRWGALVGWGAKPSLLEQGGALLAYSLLSGGLTAVMREMAADTIIGNAQNERVQVGYQRVPSAGCCAFCGMVASRGVIYASKSDAERVIGRGTPIPKNGARRRGGQARGVRPRGSQAIGEKYHDHCKCSGVPVFEDNYVEMQDGADKYFDAYAEARDKVNAGLELNVTTSKSSDGSLRNTYEWVDAGGDTISPQQRTRNIVTSMRHELGVK